MAVCFDLVDCKIHCLGLGDGGLFSSVLLFLVYPLLSRMRLHPGRDSPMEYRWYLGIRRSHQHTYEKMIDESYEPSTSQFEQKHWCQRIF